MQKTLQDLRIERNLTQEQVSKILKISKIYLSMLENGIRNPSDALKQKMSKLYNCDISDIYSAINSTKRLKNNKTNQKRTK